MDIGIHIKGKHFTTLLNALMITKKLNAHALQIYLGNNHLTTLREKIKLSSNEIKETKKYIKDNKITLFIHGILSINYCNDPTSKRYQWGIDNLSYDMDIARKVGAYGIVIHMGRMKDISLKECTKNFIASLKILLDKTKKVNILLETPVNKNGVIGGTIEDLATLYDDIPSSYKKRVKICVDTQHIFASGYDMSDIESARLYFEKFDKLIGLKNLKLIHLNDSAKEFDSKINRHERVGKGFIFSSKSGKEALKYIICKVAMKYKIPMVMETNFETYSTNIKMIQKIQKMQKMQGGKKNIKPLILKIFKKILLFHKSLNKKNQDKSKKYRIESYEKAIKSLSSFNKPIYSSKDVEDVEYIGKGFSEKIDEISTTGSLKMYDNIVKSSSSPSSTFKKKEAESQFEEIWGIGPAFAKKLVDKKILTITDLKRAIKEKKIELTKQQLIGLKYYKDLKEKIPREEITKYTDFIKKLFETKHIKIYNAGSYRLGKSESSDIDIIMAYDSDDYNLREIKRDFYDKMHSRKIIKETLIDGTDKSIYIVKKFKKYRQMDVAFVKQSDLPWYLLYFGSSKEFSKKIRAIASKRGYKLNEKGLFDKQSGKRIDFFPKNEEEIFEYIDIPYVKPEDRK